MNLPHPSLEQRTHDLYERSTRNLDLVTATHLKVLRRQAVAQPSRSRIAPLLLPAGVLAAALLAFLALVWRPAPDTLQRTSVPSTVATATSLVANTDVTDLAMAQDLNFYSWLASQAPTRQQQEQPQ